jgi:tetratricopeptide (TPR) repeat protein
METDQFNRLITGALPLTEETIDGLKTLVEEYPEFQFGWLFYLKNLKEINSPEFDTILKKVAIRVPNRKRMYEFLNSDIKNLSMNIDLDNTLSSYYDLDEEYEINPEDSLIDKFLQANTGEIRPNQKEFQNASNQYLREIAEKSIVENEEIVTETLANIYFQQKKYEKAQEAYKKLSLKYPEKSIYFATRIKEIEEIKNN